VRRVAVARVAAAAVLLAPWAVACGPGEPPDARRAAGAAGQGGSGAEAPGPSPAATPSGAPPASASPTPAARPKRSPAADRPAGGSTPRGGTTGAGGTSGNGGTSGTGGPRITSVSLTAPDPRDGFGRPVSAMHQDGCGTPERINIHVDANDGGGRLNGMWYEYVVDAPAPIRGSSDFWELGMRREDSESYKTVIGPIRAEPANAGGGTITITVHVRNTDGREAPPRRVTATLLPCR
jgi:hypothetical protein